MKPILKRPDPKVALEQKLRPQLNRVALLKQMKGAC